MSRSLKSNKHIVMVSNEAKTTFTFTQLKPIVDLTTFKVTVDCVDNIYCLTLAIKLFYVHDSR